MATNQMSMIVQHLRKATRLCEGAERTDGQLLADFVERQDEIVFAALVKRHGPMVWGVCRRVLGNHHDVEDAFQATFLVLVRKAASIAPRDNVGNWLYGVAHQTALQARRTAARRRTREKQVTQMPEPVAMEESLGRDLHPLLDQELSRLPATYRTVIVLCDLEGTIRKEAARQLGLPEGTVGSRLARGRAMLAKRLARHGLVVTGGTLAMLLAPNVTSASVPTSVVTSTTRAATLVAAGQAVTMGAISPTVAALTEGVLKTMLLNKLKIASTVLLVVLACIVGGTVALHPMAVGQAPTTTQKQEEKKAVVKGSAEDVFPGEWINVDEKTGGLTRITVTTTKDGGWIIQAWGAASGGEIDWSKTTLTLLRDYEANGDTDEEKCMNKYGFAIWVKKHADTHLTLRLEKDRLLCEAYTLFKDDRTNHYRSRYEFKKKN